MFKIRSPIVKILKTTDLQKNFKISNRENYKRLLVINYKT